MLLVKSFETKKQIKKSVTNVRELYKYTTYFWCVTVVRMSLLLVKSYETKKFKKSATVFREFYKCTTHF